MAKLVARLTKGEVDDFGCDFSTFAHDHQVPPESAANGEPWLTWLILGGRGAGKTRAGAEWVRAVALQDPKARIALVAENLPHGDDWRGPLRRDARPVAGDFL